MCSSDLNEFVEIDLENKNTDKGIINFSKNNKIVIASLDKEIKKKAKGRKIVIKEKKRLEIQ